MNTKKRLEKEIRYHEGFKYVYIVLPQELRQRRVQLVKVLSESKHGWSQDSPEFAEKI